MAEKQQRAFRTLGSGEQGIVPKMSSQALRSNLVRTPVLPFPLLSTPFHKYSRVFRRNRSLTVAALIGAARVSKRFTDTAAFSDPT